VTPTKSLLFAASAASLLAFTALSAPALANGRYPSAGQVVVHPSDPAHLVVRATYGILSTRDNGATWSWICEAAVGYGGVEDPMMGITADGTLLAGVFKGLAYSQDLGCAWSFAGGGLTDKYVTDLSVEKQDPSRAVLIVSNGVATNKFLTQLWETVDSGTTWTQAGVDLPEQFLGLNVDVAPSDPTRVYISGRYGAPDYPGALERSYDRGKTWEKLDIPGSDDTHLPYLSAVDPNNPDILYMRLDGDPVDALLVSKDAGKSWTTAFESTGNLYGFALSPDGATVYIGGSKDGLWRAPTSTLQFEKVADLLIRCLTATDVGLYACADEFTNGFTVGLSKDQGKTFAPVMHLASPCGPLACAEGTSVPVKCADAWGVTRLTIGAEPCDAGSPPDPMPTPTPSSPGCGCRAAPSAGAGAGASIGLLIAAWYRLRRRRARR